MIDSKEKIINYFKSGIKEPKNFKIGIEHEKFLFNNSNNERIDYSKIKEMFTALLEFCLLYTSPSPRDRTRSRMPSSA